MKTNSKRTRWAFWSYDLFPFILSGRVVKQSKDGFEIEGYGPGFYFKPMAVIVGEKGEKLHNDLKRFDAEYRYAERILREGFYARLKAQIPFADKIKYTI